MAFPTIAAGRVQTSKDPMINKDDGKNPGLASGSAEGLKITVALEPGYFSHVDAVSVQPIGSTAPAEVQAANVREVVVQLSELSNFHLIVVGS